jgi:hypothetical protein
LSRTIQQQAAVSHQLSECANKTVRLMTIAKTKQKEWHSRQQHILKLHPSNVSLSCV